MDEMYGIHYYKDDKNIIWVDAADTAKEIGLVDERKSGNRAGESFIRWNRMNQYIKSVGELSNNDIAARSDGNMVTYPYQMVWIILKDLFGDPFIFH